MEEAQADPARLQEQVLGPADCKAAIAMQPSIGSLDPPPPSRRSRRPAFVGGQKAPGAVRDERDQPLRLRLIPQWVLVAPLVGDHPGAFRHLQRNAAQSRHPQRLLTDVAGRRHAQGQSRWRR